jgi:hypothetical protein
MLLRKVVGKDETRFMSETLFSVSPAVSEIITHMRGRAPEFLGNANISELAALITCLVSHS